MTLLDRFRTQSRHKHPDPAVRLSHVEELPVEDRAMIAAIAREDEEPRVRRAAVSKLMDPTVLGSVARDDPDESVRGAAAVMLRDIALEAFEGLAEADSLDAVDALVDVKLLAYIARSAAREIVALRALSRVNDAHSLGSIARHAGSEAARLGALESLRERGERDEVLAVALNGEHKDTALAAVDLLADRRDLEQIAARAKNRSTAKRARVALRAAEDHAASETVEAATAIPITRSATELAETSDHGHASVSLQSEAGSDVRLLPQREFGSGVPHVDPLHARLAVEKAEQETARRREAAQAAAARARQQAADEAARRESERRHARLAELADIATRASADQDLSAARRVLGVARVEWSDLSSGTTVDPALTSRFADLEAQVATRVAEADETDARTRREALARLRHLLGRVEPLLAKADLSLRAADRALRHVRAAISAIPPLPTRQDAEEVTRRLKAVQTALTPRVQELRAAEEWQRWANVTVQEQLSARMEALSAIEDPDAIAREVRTLQQQWRQAADVPRPQADALWRRFKAAHDAVWPRCEAHFAAQTRVRAENLARKTAFCEAAEALADSTRWIQTAEEIKRLQAEWKTVGPVSGGTEKAVWDRFRAACDRFFTRRQADLAERKRTWAENLAKKEALLARAEALADSTDWDQAAAEMKRLEADWRMVGAVKKSRSEAIWRRFHDACNRFFARYARRHDVARAERIAARETIYAELESLAFAPSEPGGAASNLAASTSDDRRAASASQAPPSDLLARVRDARTRWQRETAAGGVNPDRAGALDSRFAAALGRVLSDWPTVFAGTELDVEANRRGMELLVRRIEDVAASIAGSAGATPGVDGALSPAARLAAMLKEALAANTIGGKVDEDSQWRAAADEVQQVQAAWARIGIVTEDARRVLADRFHRACRRVTERVGSAGATPRSGGAGMPGVVGKAGGPGRGRRSRAPALTRST